jgi:hypothetical protein
VQAWTHQSIKPNFPPHTLGIQYSRFCHAVWVCTMPPNLDTLSYHITDIILGQSTINACVAPMHLSVMDVPLPQACNQLTLYIVLPDYVLHVALLVNYSILVKQWHDKMSNDMIMIQWCKTIILSTSPTTILLNM